jgi:hypothetical protein
MKPWILCLALLPGVVACESKRDKAEETGTRSSSDTLVVEREMRDTAIIRHDTTVTIDTTMKRGARPVDVDTVNR